MPFLCDSMEWDGMITRGKKNRSINVILLASLPKKGPNTRDEYLSQKQLDRFMPANILSGCF